MSQTNHKIRLDHLRRRAYIYIHQSTLPEELRFHP